jgi:hypothetical protein
MNHQIEKLNEAIAPLRNEIIHHPVYSAIQDIQHLNVFMQYHVYAVWDFMCLLKTLQRNLTCTTVPWFPTGSADTRYLINEIVVGEESDVDPNGIRKSHFELYLDAMHQRGANTNGIHTFIDTLKTTGNMQEAFLAAQTPPEAEDFVNFTFRIINSNKPYLQAAIFTFGREDLIPGMFLSMVNDIYRHEPQHISIFKYYLDRHIEIDGDHHSHLALEMTTNLCGTDAQLWEEALQATKESLQKRIRLWNGAYHQIRQMQSGRMAY